jgi:hypothetical protein
MLILFVLPLVAFAGSAFLGRAMYKLDQQYFEHQDDKSANRERVNQ